MFKRTNITTRSLADGTDLNIPIFTFEGSNPNAPQVYIQSSIHGAEVQGSGIILHLIEYLLQHPPQSTITLVPNVNPFSLNQRLGDYGFSRFDPNTGDNWNRLYTNITCCTPPEKTAEDQIVIEEFLKEIPPNTPPPQVIQKLRAEIIKRLTQRLSTPSLLPYGQKLALQIQLMATQADIVLDLHCDTISIPHLYSPNYAVNSAHHFNIPYIIAIPEKFAGALDEATFTPWSNLAKTWNSPHYPKPHTESFTLEYGSQEVLDLPLAKQQAQGILHYLSTKQACPPLSTTQQNPLPNIQVTPLKNLINIYAPQSGYLTYLPPLGQKINPGQPLLEILQINNLTTPPPSNLKTPLSNENSILKNLTTPLPATHPCIPIVHCCGITVHEGLPVMKILNLN